MVMYALAEILRYLRMAAAHPFAVVIIAALLAALIEQHYAKKRTPDFSSDERDAFGRPAPRGPL
jgi:hypothetical protein